MTHFASWRFYHSVMQQRHASDDNTDSTKFILIEKGTVSPFNYAFNHVRALRGSFLTKSVFDRSGTESGTCTGHVRVTDSRSKLIVGMLYHSRSLIATHAFVVDASNGSSHLVSVDAFFSRCDHWQLIRDCIHVTFACSCQPRNV